MTTPEPGTPETETKITQPFNEAEVLAAAEGPSTDPELDDVAPASIDEAPEVETPIEKLRASSKRMSAEKIRTVIESLLFVSEAPLTERAICDATGLDEPRVHEALLKIQGDFREGVRGVVLCEIAAGWQFRTDPGSADYVRRFLKVKPTRLTRAAVETLAIIAYRQPVTRPEIEDVRGVDSGAVLKALLERRLVKILGKKDEVGRPIIYGTTREFLEFFALRDLAQLPTLREFQELSEDSQAIVEREAPVPAAGTVEALSDPEFNTRLKEQARASEDALLELEEAIDHADSAARLAETTLKVPEPTEEPAPQPS